MNPTTQFLASLPTEADGQVRRVAEKFALLASTERIINEPNYLVLTQIS